MAEIVPERLPASEVVTALKQVVSPRGNRPHWSLTSKLLTRIVHECLYQREMAWYGTPYETAEEFADIELGMPRSEFFAYRRLGSLIDRDRTQPWEQLSRSQAAQLASIAGMDDLGRWVRLALTLPYAELRRRIEKLLRPGQEAFIRVAFRAPESVVMLWESSLVEALPTVLGQTAPDPELAKDPAIRFRCVEVIARDYGRAGPLVVVLARTLAQCYPMLVAAGHTAIAEQAARLIEDVADGKVLV